MLPTRPLPPARLAATTPPGNWLPGPVLLVTPRAALLRLVVHGPFPRIPSTSPVEPQPGAEAGGPHLCIGTGESSPGGKVCRHHQQPDREESLSWRHGMLLGHTLLFFRKSVIAFANS